MSGSASLNSFHEVNPLLCTRHCAISSKPSCMSIEDCSFSEELEQCDSCLLVWHLNPEVLKLNGISVEEVVTTKTKSVLQHKIWGIDLTAKAQKLTGTSSVH